MDCDVGGAAALLEAGFPLFLEAGFPVLLEVGFPVLLEAGFPSLLEVGFATSHRSACHPYHRPSAAHRVTVIGCCTWEAAAAAACSSHRPQHYKICRASLHHASCGGAFSWVGHRHPAAAAGKARVAEAAVGPWLLACRTDEAALHRSQIAPRAAHLGP